MSIAILLLILVAVIGSGSMVAVLALVMGRIKHLEGGQHRTDQMAEISQQLAAVQEQLVSVEDEMARLNERVDFTEKLLGPPDA